MESLRRRYKDVTDPDQAWIRPMATALQGGHLVYLMGAMFVGIAFQPFVWMIISLQIGVHTYIKRREQEARWRPLAVQLGNAPAGPEGVGLVPAGVESERPSATGWKPLGR
jgi:hypothetical protein